jgi:hypothetical protein
VFGNPVTFTATVSPVSPGAGVPTGTATFTFDGSPTGTAVTLTSGQAQLTTSSLSPGLHTLAVAFAPATSEFAYSTGSLAGGQQISRAPSTTTVTQSPNPVAFGQPMTLKATVAPVVPAVGTPTGTVQFKNGAAALGPAVALSGGQALLTISSLPPGQTITAVYSGDTSFLSSTGSMSPAITFGHTLSGPCTSGNLTISGGTWLLSGACIGGTLTVAAGTSVAIVNSTISNNLTATSPGAFSLCGSNVVGNLSVSGASGYVLVGDPGDSGCAANSLRAVALSSNGAGVELGQNTISGNVSLTGNRGGGPYPEDASPSVEANRIQGTLACSGNAPPATNNGKPNTVTGTRSGECGVAGF